MLIKDRLGKFSISLDLIEQHPAAVCLLFKDIIVLEATWNKKSLSIDYFACSKLFNYQTYPYNIPTYMLELAPDNTVVATII